ncbi:hypothetical protein Q1695_007961 [Nippostrongylus brasiliensis]|nr:hypothetical protein Q1695_007961 [Nippostrongylus brasiliensis]
MTSARYNIIRRLTSIFAASGVLVFIAYQLISDDYMVEASQHRKRSVSGPFDEQPFAEVIVHLDLKGAPPIVSVYRWLFPLLKLNGVRSVLMEYEDMLPYYGELSVIKRARHYNDSDIREISRIAAENSLEIIPLVQTFGHLEFVLKHPAFLHLRENPGADNTICPSDPQSLELIREMLKQIHILHPRSTRIHIGADEASHIAEDERCRKRLRLFDQTSEHRAKEKLKLAHIAKVARLSRDLGFKEVFAWNDMFDKSDVEDMRDAKLGDLITPVVWGYKADVTEPGYFPDHLFDRLSKVFSKLFFASAFKGATRIDEDFIDVDRYLRNHMSYVKLYQENRQALQGRVGGIIVTGWQRYMHHAPLCELLMVSIPSLVTDLVYLLNVTRNRNDIWRDVRKLLRCPAHLESTVVPEKIGEMLFVPHKDAFLNLCDFQGSRLYKLIMEDFYLLKWKVRHSSQLSNTTSLILEEIEGLANLVADELRNYHYPEDVDEFVTTKILSLKEKLDRRSSKESDDS